MYIDSLGMDCPADAVGWLGVGASGSRSGGTDVTTT
jgi:hypothetical protein